MSRRPAETVQVNLRMKESFRRRIEREASKHQLSLNKEMLNRLEDSLEREARKTVDVIATDLERNWMRYGQRFLLLDLQEQLAEALAKTQDPEVSKLAKGWLMTKRSWPEGENR